MIKLLAKLFIKDYSNYNSTEVRTKYGLLSGFVGLFFNTILFSLKLFIGTVTKSIAIIADGFNNLSDASLSVIQLIGFKLSNKKPDDEHPFGHGRIEYICALIISIFIILMGIDLFKDSVLRIKNPAETQYSIYAIIIMGASILVKLYMFLYNHFIAKKINSLAIETTAKDSFSDMFATSVVIISIVINKITSLKIDGVAGTLVASFILYTGYDSARESISSLIGTKLPKDVYKQIETEVMKNKTILGMHDLIIHDYGPERMMVSLHVEVPGDKNIFELHEIIDRIENAISRKYNCNTVIHMDPIDVNDERLKYYKKLIAEKIKEINSQLEVHDIRRSKKNKKTKLFFDVVKPYSLKMSNEQLCEKISSAIKTAVPNTSCSITIDNPLY